MAPAAPIQSVYVHVPFCARKCAYCAFYSEASDGPLIDRYVAALVRELESVSPELKPATVFFGGGTPSLLNLRQWETIFSTVRRFGLEGASEWTVECNPATVSLDKARLWRSSGVNRVSMGVQSLDETMLDRLGRIHSREAVFKSFDLLRRAGFDNLNVDLMFAIPGQSMHTWRSTLQEALALGSEHVSCYEVIYEEDTPLFYQLQAGEFSVDEDLACAMYEELMDRVTAAGLEQYEVANFARGRASSTGAQRQGGVPGGEGPFRLSAAECVGESTEAYSMTVSSRCDPEAGPHGVDGAALPAFACRHNVNYWRGGWYHGLGPSAAGYVRGRRTRNVSNTQAYCSRLESGQRPVEWTEDLPARARAGETAAFGLRMNLGWDFTQFQKITGFDLRAEWEADMADLAARGWARHTPNRFHLTQQGMRFADAAAGQFLR